MIHKGDLIIKEGNTTDYSKLVEVIGYIYLMEECKAHNKTNQKPKTQTSR